MVKERRRKKNSFSIFLIIIFACVLVISAGFFFFYYNAYERASRDETINAKAAELSASGQYMKNLFNTLNLQINSITYTRELYSWSESSDYSDYHSVIDVLSENRNRQSIIHSIYVVIESDDLVLTSSEGYFSTEDFYDDTWVLYGTGKLQKVEGMTNVEISGEHYLTPHAIQGGDVISLVCELKEGNSSWESDYKKYLVINLALNKMESVLNTSSWDTSHEAEEGGAAILSDDASLLYDGTKGTLSNFTDEELKTFVDEDRTWISKNEKGIYWLCLKQEIPTTGLYILQVSGMEPGYSATNTARDFMWIATGISIVAIVILLIQIWRRVYLPYRRLMAKARKGDMISENVDGMEYLEEVMARALDSKQVLTEAWLEHMLLGKDSEKMADQELVNLGEFYALLFSAKGENVEEHAFSSIQMTDLKNNVRQYVMEEQKDLPVENCYCVEMNDQKLVALLEMNDRISEDILKPFLQLLISYLSMHQNRDIYLGVSGPHSGESELHQSYLEARDALGFSYFYPNRSIFYYKTSSLVKREFYIEDSVKMEIFANNLNSLNIEEAKQTFSSIVSDLQKKQENTIYYNLSNVFSRMFEQVYRAARNFGLEPDEFFSLSTNNEKQFLHTWEFDSMEEAVKTMNTMLNQLLDFQLRQESTSNKTNKPNKPWGKIMLDYVEENYDKGISLKTMAHDLGLDESYLSKQFKEKVGVSFIQYVTKCRMEKAKEMLRDSTLRLTEIAKAVGMGNVQSFIRTFKKYEGMTPGEYRSEYLHDNKS